MYQFVKSSLICEYCECAVVGNLKDIVLLIGVTFHSYRSYKSFYIDRTDQHFNV